MITTAQQTALNALVEEYRKRLGGGMNEIYISRQTHTLVIDGCFDDLDYLEEVTATYREFLAKRTRILKGEL